MHRRSRPGPSWSWMAVGLRHEQRSDRPRGSGPSRSCQDGAPERALAQVDAGPGCQDRKSTRLNSSHGYISYAVFCLKKKKKTDSQFFLVKKKKKKEQYKNV